MGFFDAIVGGGVGKLVKDVVGSFKLSPQAQLEFDAKIAEHQYALALKDRELEAKLAEFQAKEIESASANIRAEAGSADSYTSRARPTFLYLIYIILAWNYILIPTVLLFKAQPPAPINLPGDLLTLFGAGYLGYTHYRSADKKRGS